MHLAPQNKGKGKAKATEDDDNDEETAQKLRKELEDFVVLTTSDDKLLVSLLPPPSEYFEGDSGLPQGAKILVELTGAKRRKEIMELDNEVEIVAAKIPAAGPSCPTSKPIVLVPSTSKFIPKLIVTLASPLAGPSTAPIASSSAPKPVSAAALQNLRFKLAGIEESGVQIINQATEVPATQGTLHSEESGEDTEGDNDNGNGGDVAMNIDSAKQPEETWPVAPIKIVTEVKAPALLTKPQRTPFLKLHCTAEHFPYWPSGLQAPIQFEQN
ncbi:hypothetical protein C0995_009200 [Termitomyces sp. Mi166|nr:hypothetical protein C0995_009200 [Termitomyces sp. Mi166\